jgi:hypothetical protein
MVRPQGVPAIRLAVLVIHAALCKVVRPIEIRVGLALGLDGTSIGDTTLWRWLAEDAIRPWAHRSWIFPRAPGFQEKAERVLDLYEGSWGGKRLGADDFAISADEKTSIQARRRIHPTLPTTAGREMRVEHEYQRAGAWAYL